MFYFLIIIEDCEIHSLQEEQLVLAWKSKSLLLKAFFKKKNPQKTSKNFFFLNFPQCSVISCSSWNLNSLNSGPWKNNSLCYWSKEVTPHCTGVFSLPFGCCCSLGGRGFGPSNARRMNCRPFPGAGRMAGALGAPPVSYSHTSRPKVEADFVLVSKLVLRRKPKTTHSIRTWVMTRGPSSWRVYGKKPSLNMTHRRSGCQPHDKEKQ